MHTTAVYRRWTGRPELVTDAVLDASAAGLAIPATGDLEADLQTFARALLSWLTPRG